MKTAQLTFLMQRKPTARTTQHHEFYEATTLKQSFISISKVHLFLQFHQQE